MNEKSVVQYDESFTFQSLGLQPKLILVGQWANGAITARQNDGFGDDDVWVRYGRLALANLGTSIDLTKVANPISNFADVNDYVFFTDKTIIDMLWGNAFSQTHNLSLSGRTEKPVTGYH